MRPQITIAIENVKLAARAAQPRVISMVSDHVRQPAYLHSPQLPAQAMTRTPLATPDRQVTTRRQGAPYPRVRVIVLDDDVNTFEHVVRVLVRIIPGMHTDQAWTLAHQIDGEGAAVVWTGPLEQGELYHHQLAAEGLTMAPLESL